MYNVCLILFQVVYSTYIHYDNTTLLFYLIHCAPKIIAKPASILVCLTADLTQLNPHSRQIRLLCSHLSDIKKTKFTKYSIVTGNDNLTVELEQLVVSAQ